MISSLMVAGLARKSWKAGTPWRVPNKICFDPPRETRKSSSDTKESPEIGSLYQMNVNNLFWGPNSINHQICVCVCVCHSAHPVTIASHLDSPPEPCITLWRIHQLNHGLSGHVNVFCWTADKIAVQRMFLDSYTHAKVLPNTAIQTYTTHGLLHWCHQWSKYKASGSFPYIVFVLSSTPFANHCHASTPSLTQANHARTYALDQWTCSPQHMASWWLMLTLSTA